MKTIAFTLNRLLAVLAHLSVLTLAAGMAWAAAETEQAVSMDKEMVLDPTTGEMITAPEYGGTLTYALRGDPPNPDTFYRHPPAMVAALVVEKLGMANLGVDRNYFDFRTNYLPDDIVVGRLAESWEQPDANTVVFNIRSGVHWHDKAPMNGRELTAEDVVFNFHRYLGLGSGFTEVPEGVAAVSSLAAGRRPGEKEMVHRIGAFRAGNQVIFKLTALNLDAVKTLAIQNITFIYPPEVIMEHGDVADWRNLVGTGPFELVDWVEASSVTFNKALQLLEARRALPGQPAALRGRTGGAGDAGAADPRGGAALGPGRLHRLLRQLTDQRYRPGGKHQAHPPGHRAAALLLPLRDLGAGQRHAAAVR